MCLLDPFCPRRDSFDFSAGYLCTPQKGRLDMPIFQVSVWHLVATKMSQVGLEVGHSCAEPQTIPQVHSGIM